MKTIGRPLRALVSSTTPLPVFLFAALLAASAVRTPAANPPHDTTNSVDCVSCHLPHHSPDGNRFTQTGNPNLCLSCHEPGGVASRYTLVDSDQAVAGPGLPASVSATGTSHRWSSSLGGYAAYLGGARSNSSGLVTVVGDYTGRVAKTYVLTITADGQVGAAKFDWYGTAPGGGGVSNVTVTNLVALDQGISVAFSNGTINPSFRSNDTWAIVQHPDISQPTNALLTAAISNALLSCSVCHDQHSQTNAPFDPAAPATPGVAGRHFQRIDNSACQLCTDCHASRNVTNASAGSHPVGVTIPGTGFFKSPSTLPLEKTANKVRCLTCHDIHNSGSPDGSLLRIASRVSLCTECHTLADTNTAAHLSLVGGVLWPGGQYGTTFPAETDTSQRGMCVQCHQPHGWPTSLVSSVDFTNLLVEFEERLCFTCHDGSPAAATNSVIDDFTNTAKVSHHPVVNTDPLRKPGRPVECVDCHNPHKAQVGRSIYTNTATSTRNLVVAPNVGASGVAVNYSGLTNFAAIATNNYTFTNSVTYEYQICFKCHSGYAWGTNAPPIGLSPNGSVVTNETDLAQEFSPNNLAGHPIITGLSNYVNAVSPKGLTIARMKAPWNTSANIGRQTMLCTDCHNTDSTLAQGPHGSAAQFMLRGPNSSAWPDLDISSYASSWCANCHNPVTSIHDQGAHAGILRCYSCHIVVPHGGAISRLIADQDNSMPSRYAFNNNKSNVEMLGFRKASSYNGDNQCNTACGDHTYTGAGSENW